MSPDTPAGELADDPVAGPGDALPHAAHAAYPALAFRGASARVRFRAGLRAGLPFAIAGGLLSLSFAVVAQDAGFSPAAVIIMTAVVFAGSAQFAAVTIIASGGTAGAAVLAAALVNSRFLPMGVALAPSLPGGPLRRAAQGQAVVDASWALSARGDGTFDRWLLFGSTAIQYVIWIAGTTIGVLADNAIKNPGALGLDAVFPAFFVYLVLGEIRDRRSRTVAILGGVIALALVPFTPVGVPVLLASVAALLGLTRSARADMRARVAAVAGTGAGEPPA